MIRFQGDLKVEFICASQTLAMLLPWLAAPSDDSLNAAIMLTMSVLGKEPLVTSHTLLVVMLAVFTSAPQLGAVSVPVRGLLLPYITVSSAQSRRSVESVAVTAEYPSAVSAVLMDAQDRVNVLLA